MVQGKRLHSQLVLAGSSRPLEKFPQVMLVCPTRELAVQNLEAKVTKFCTDNPVSLKLIVRKSGQERKILNRYSLRRWFA